MAAYNISLHPDTFRPHDGVTTITAIIENTHEDPDTPNITKTFSLAYSARNGVIDVSELESTIFDTFTVVVPSDGYILPVQRPIKFNSFTFPSDSNRLYVCLIDVDRGRMIANHSVYIDAPPVIKNTSVESDWSGDPNLFIQDITTATFSVTCAGQYGATISRVIGDYIGLDVYFTESGGVYTGTMFTDNPSNAGLIVTVRDSRGAESQTTIPLVVRVHEAPEISYDIYRCDQNGDRDMGGGYIAVTAWANSSPSAIGIDSVTVSIADQDEEYIIYAQPVTNGVKAVFGNGSYSNDEYYTIYINTRDSAYDYGSTSLSGEAIKVLVPVKRVINFADRGEGIAFGKLATANRVDSAWPIYADGGIHAYLSQYCDYGDGVDIQRNRAIGLVTNSATQDGIRTFSRAGILQWSPSAVDGELTDIYEAYRFPTVERGLASNKTYDILTTKNINDFPDASATEAGKVSTGAQTFAGQKTFTSLPRYQTGGTDYNLLSTQTIGLTQVFEDTSMGANVVRTYTVPDLARGILIINGANNTGRGLYIFSATSAGAVTFTAVASSSLVTVTTGTNSITLTKSSSGTSMFPTFIMFNKTVTKQ